MVTSPKPREPLQIDRAAMGLSDLRSNPEDTSRGRRCATLFVGFAPVAACILPAFHGFPDFFQRDFSRPAPVLIGGPGGLPTISGAAPRIIGAAPLGLVLASGSPLRP